MERSRPRAVISLLTDFGLRDAYVGAMKGAIARLAPDALVIDISHEVPPQDILSGGLLWAAAVPYFPEGSVHVAVVDPGVGTRRKVLAVEARGCIFLAPDNGILGCVLEKREIARCYEVRRRSLFLRPVSRTFHGRDVFAPVAARLACGLPPREVGPAAQPAVWMRVPRPRARVRREGTETRVEERGVILAFDAFGNAITNLRPRRGFRLARLRTGSLETRRLARTYADAEPGGAVALEGSSGYLEVAVRGGSAERELALERGQAVAAEWRRREEPGRRAARRQSGPTG